MSIPDHQKLSRAALTAMVVGSMVGAGIFSLPARFGSATGPFGALISWTIAGGGMLTLAWVFQTLAVRRPGIDAGIYAYAREGFGAYPGFAAAFGFWAGTCLGNTTYFILIKSTLGAILPVFGDGNTPVAVAVSSALLWLIHALVLRGIKEAAFINQIVTAAKIVPIVLFVVILAFAFQADLFAEGFWGGGAFESANLLGQIRSTMLVTVFVFIGIEGASVYSRFARTRRDVGWATIAGFAGVMGLLVLVTLLPYGVVPRAELAAMRQPSMGGVLAQVVGPWGSWFVGIGLIVSVLGAYLAWTLLAAEVLYSAARSGLAPAWLARENAKGVPAAALWLTNGLVQFFLISTLFSQEAFDLALEMTSAITLVPYVLVAAYGCKVAKAAQGYAGEPRAARRDLIVAGLATVYAVFMIYAGGLKYLLLSCLLFAPGTALFIFARRERGERVFSRREKCLFGVIVAGALAAVGALASGAIAI
ncbi:MAG: basic amino acid/polyamine antiporter [Candidatus Dactylopiibacterium sp.]|nr:basic amino acid/polyamine antiporter [Candidatus Dactylopiibacterium sp.]